MSIYSSPCSLMIKPLRTITPQPPPRLLATRLSLLVHLPCTGHRTGHGTRSLRQGAGVPDRLQRAAGGNKRYQWFEGRTPEPHVWNGMRRPSWVGVFLFWWLGALDFDLTILRSEHGDLGPESRRPMLQRNSEATTGVLRDAVQCWLRF